MATNKEIVVTLRLEDRGAVQQLGELKALLVQQQTERNKLQATIRKGIALTNEEKERLGQLGAATRNTSVQIRELENKISGATDAGLRFRDKMADAAKAGLGAFGLNILSVAGGITALVGVLRNAVNTLADFEKALSAVSALGGDYAARIGEISEATKTAGIEFGFTAVESVNAVEALAKAGVAVEDILGGGLEGALTLAAAGALDVATAAEAAAKAMVQFGLSGQDVTHIADLFANSANKALGEVSDITAALNQSGQVANQFGVSIEETVGTLTAFANAGLLGSDAGTSFRTMLIRLAKPTEDSAKLMEQLGINAFDAQGQFIGIEKLAGQLQTQLSGLTEEQRNSTLATIFGTDAIRSASILYEGGADAINKWTTEVSESGEAARIAAEKTNNLQGDLDKLGASYDALILNGGGLSDLLRTITQDLTDQVTAASKAENAFTAIAALLNPLVANAVTAQAALGDVQKSLNEDPLGIFKATTEELNKRLEEINKQRSEFIAVGKDYEAGMRDGEAAQIKAALSARELAAETAKVGAAATGAATGIDEQTTATVKLTAAQIEANRVAKEIAEIASAPPSVIQPVETSLPSASPLARTPEAIEEFNAAQEALRIAEIEGTATLNLELLALDEQYFQAKTIGLEEYEARKAAIQQQAEQTEFENQQRMVAAAGDFFGALSSIAAEGSAEFKALATTQALINTYLGATQALSNPLVLNPFVKIAQAAAIILNGLSAVSRIQGFAEGGFTAPGKKHDVAGIVHAGEYVVPKSVVEDPDYAHLLSALENRRQRGYAGGGSVAGSVRFTRGAAIAPRPSPGELIATERLAEARATNFAPVVSVVEINKVQNRTKVIENLASA